MKNDLTSFAIATRTVVGALCTAAPIAAQVAGGSSAGWRLRRVSVPELPVCAIR
jgi:hypothetical protein